MIVMIVMIMKVMMLMMMMIYSYDDDELTYGRRYYINNN